jgi:hypothetical protein
MPVFFCKRAHVRARARFCFNSGKGRDTDTFFNVIDHWENA